MSALPFQGGVIFRTTFDPDSGFGTYAMLTAMHGHFTLKQLRLPVLNETHTNIYTGPRLIVKIEQLATKQDNNNLKHIFVAYILGREVLENNSDRTV